MFVNRSTAVLFRVLYAIVVFRNEANLFIPALWKRSSSDQGEQKWEKTRFLSENWEDQVPEPRAHRWSARPRSEFQTSSTLQSDSLSFSLSLSRSSPAGKTSDQTGRFMAFEILSDVWTRIRFSPFSRASLSSSVRKSNSPKHSFFFFFFFFFFFLPTREHFVRSCVSRYCTLLRATWNIIRTSTWTRKLGGKLCEQMVKRQSGEPITMFVQRRNKYTHVRSSRDKLETSSSMLLPVCLISLSRCC